MTQTLWNGDRVVNVDTRLTPRRAARVGAADIEVWVSGFFALLGVQLSRRWPSCANFVHTCVWDHRSGIGAELQVRVGVLVIVLIVEPSGKCAAQSKNNQPGSAHAACQKRAALAPLKSKAVCKLLTTECTCVTPTSTVCPRRDLRNLLPFTGLSHSSTVAITWCRTRTRPDALYHQQRRQGAATGTLAERHHLEGGASNR